MTDPAIERFLSRVSGHDGFEPLSDAKIASLDVGNMHVIIAEDEAILAVGSMARHTHKGGQHFAIETAVDPPMRFPAFEAAVLAATESMIPAGAPRSAWSQQRSTDRALEDRGYVARRSLHYMALALPLTDIIPDDPRESVVLRPFELEDTPSVISVNNQAFHAHPEAGRLTNEEMKRLVSQDWFDSAGLIVAESPDGVAGFCWTRVHPNGDGEIFRVAVDPAHQSVGLGRRLVGAGFARLSQEGRVERGTLWVDASNEPAMALYRSLGMQIERTNREFEPKSQPKR